MPLSWTVLVCGEVLDGVTHAAAVLSAAEVAAARASAGQVLEPGLVETFRRERGVAVVGTEATERTKVVVRSKVGWLDRNTGFEYTSREYDCSDAAWKE